MISIKKFLDSDMSEVPIQKEEADELTVAATECFRALLAVIGKNAAEISPVLGSNLESNLQGLGRRLAVEFTPGSLRRTEKQIEVQLDEWGARTAQHFKSMADEVKELLIALAKTAESVGSRDQGYADKFKDLTGRLEKIGDLNDLAQIRSTLVERVTELRSSVDQMTRENQELVSQLRAEVSTYESKLKSVETLALKDELTQVANRRSIEERIRWNIANAQEFSIAVLDLNGFKKVNDTYGHLAGDDLLKQFAGELELNTRSGDLVGRWGGDEFIVVLTCNLQRAQEYVERMRHWVFGKYTVREAGGPAYELPVSASVGVAEWHAGETMADLIAAADAGMYTDKRQSKRME